MRETTRGGPVFVELCLGDPFGGPTAACLSQTGHCCRVCLRGLCVYVLWLSLRDSILSGTSHIPYHPSPHLPPPTVMLSRTSAHSSRTCPALFMSDIQSLAPQPATPSQLSTMADPEFPCSMFVYARPPPLLSRPSSFPLKVLSCLRLTTSLSLPL